MIMMMMKRLGYIAQVISLLLRCPSKLCLQIISVIIMVYPTTLYRCHDSINQSDRYVFMNCTLFVMLQLQLLLLLLTSISDGCQLNRIYPMKSFLDLKLIFRFRFAFFVCFVLGKKIEFFFRRILWAILNPVLRSDFTFRQFNLNCS